ncbi:hypothetical protein [Aurantibacillus circumpalustris]|uniref:hypothetical protein n=1 Tax=Aurantibacillus circumpalustris TaxID=3036359 RepID=UPI00295BD813|nr:hypothetical protein [Aurantibacillus circumpalustris]
MKKNIYTIAFVAVFGTMLNAQSSDNIQKSEPAKVETVNPDGTLSQMPSATAAPVANDNILSAPTDKKVEEKAQNNPKMVNPEKGTPTPAKQIEGKKAEPTKTEKH